MNILLIILLALPAGAPRTKAKPTNEAQQQPDKVLDSTVGICTDPAVCPNIPIPPIQCYSFDKQYIKSMLCRFELGNTFTDIAFRYDAKRTFRSEVFEDDTIKFWFVLVVDTQYAEAYTYTPKVIQRLIRIVGFKQRYHLLMLFTEDKTGKKPIVVRYVWGAK